MSWAGFVLLQVNVLLAMFGGAALCTGARLRWDPSLYVVLRLAAPLEYRSALLVLPAAGASLLALATLAAAALSLGPECRRVTLTLYVCAATTLWVVSAGWLSWLGRRALSAAALPQTAAALRDAELLALHLQPLLELLARWLPLPEHLQDIIRHRKQATAPRACAAPPSSGWGSIEVLRCCGLLLTEARADLPYNAYVCVAAVALLALLLPAGTATAGLLAWRDRPHRPHRQPHAVTPRSVEIEENKPLKSAVKKGLVRA